MRRERGEREMPAGRREPALTGRPTRAEDLRGARADAFAALEPARTSGVRTVLAAVDCTPFGEHALPVAAAIARQSGAELRVVHAFSAAAVRDEIVRLLGAEIPHWVDVERRRRADYLEMLARRAARANGVAATTALLDGSDVVGRLCEASADADLVVMATRDKGAWARFWRGSVSTAVVRGAHCPVMLVRGSDDPLDLAAALRPCDALVLPAGSAREGEAVRAGVAAGPVSSPAACCA